MKGAHIHNHWGFLNWKEPYKHHGFLSALSNPSEYTSLSHLAHMPGKPQIIQSSFSCAAGFHHLQRVCTAAGRGKQVQEACQLFCSNRTQLGADLECSSLPGILLPKQTSPCLVSHGSFLYRAALLGLSSDYALDWWMPFPSWVPCSQSSALCWVFGKLGLISWEDVVPAVNVGVLPSPFLHHFVFTPNGIHMILPSCFLSNCENVVSSSINGQIYTSGWVISVFMLCSCHSLFCTNQNKDLQIAPNCTWAMTAFRQISLLDLCLVSGIFSWSSN